ncbi:MAG: hypothetical protein OSB00_06615 [Sphingomonas bacterium]|nr:hypothetical protein [Sphingomonas bacterium]
MFGLNPQEGMTPPFAEQPMQPDMHGPGQRDMPTDPQFEQAQPAAAFQWGAGGQRLTPEDIATQRTLAQQQMAAGMDYSPVQSITQGAARVAQALVGRLQMGRLDKASAANASAEQQIVRSLMGAGGDDPHMLSAIADPSLSDGAREALKLKWTASHKAPLAPHYWETNNGSLGMIGADGKPIIAYQDPDAKMNYVPDGQGGGQWVAVPSGLGAGGTPPPPGVTFTPIPAPGGAGSGPRTFP